MQPTGIPAGPIITESGRTSKTLILIGLILQILEVAVFVVIALAGTVLLLGAGLLFLPLAVLGILWVIIVYAFGYERTSRGEYMRARTPLLVIAILSLITLSIIAAILYFIAWAKLGDAVQEQERARAQQAPVAPAQYWTPPPPQTSLPPGNPPSR
ncbi:MAG: hypothetical protein QXG65_03755 [Thermoplasmata archaeon]